MIEGNKMEKVADTYLQNEETILVGKRHPMADAIDTGKIPVFCSKEQIVQRQQVLMSLK